MAAEPPDAAPDEPTDPWLPGWPGIALPLVVVGLAWLVAMIIPLTSGAFWPIVAADELLEHGGWRLTQDSASPLPLRADSWVVQPWLPALVLRGAWLAAGVPGLVILQGMLAVMLALLVWRLARSVAAPIPAAITSIVVGILLLPGALRTEQFALILGALLLLTVRGRWWWLAPLLVAAWANTHGSVPLALAIVLAAVLGMLRTPSAATTQPLLEQRWYVRLAWLAACMLATLASPIGIGIVEYVRTVQSLPLIESLTPIWRGVDLLGPRGVLVMVIVAVVLIVGWRSPRTRATWLPLLPLLVLVAASIDAARYLAWLALLVAIELAHALEQIRRRRGWSGELRSSIIAVALLVPVLATGALLAPGTDRQDTFARRGLPEPALLADLRDDDEDVVLASAEWADYVRLATDSQIVVDARLERFRDRDLRDYVRFLEDGDPALMSRTGAWYVLVRDATAGDAWDKRPRRSPFADATLERVARTDRGTLYIVLCPYDEC